MLEQAIRACPEEQWDTGEPRFWYLAYHTLFFLDFCESADLILSQAESLVLLEFLAHQCGDEQLRVADPVAEQALANIHADWQGQTLEPLMPNHLNCSRLPGPQRAHRNKL